MNDHDFDKGSRRRGMRLAHGDDSAAETCAPLRGPEPVRGRVGIQKEIPGMRRLGAGDTTRAVVTRASVLVVALTLVGGALMAVPKRQRPLTAQAEIYKSLPPPAPLATAVPQAKPYFCGH